MRLKCIGGACNGRVEEVDSYYRYRVGDQVRVMNRIEILAVEFNPTVIPDTVDIPCYYYKIEAFHFKNQTSIKFLIPVNWTLEEALRYVVGV